MLINGGAYHKCSDTSEAFNVFLMKCLSLKVTNIALGNNQSEYLLIAYGPYYT